jgi:hypothetical protein
LTIGYPTPGLSDFGIRLTASGQFPRRNIHSGKLNSILSKGLFLNPNWHTG